MPNSNYLNKFWRASTNNKKHIVIIVLASAWLRLMLLIVPRHWYAKRFGKHYRNLQLCTLANQAEVIKSIKTAGFVTRVCEKTPWSSRCLVQAIIVCEYLKRDSIPYVLHFGLRRDSSNASQLLAHAWVIVKNHIVCGDQEEGNFTIISTYSNIEGDSD